MNKPEKIPTSVEALKARIGEEVGVSDWHLIDQARIDGFAEVTDDHQFIHVDPVRAKAETPFGGTIAHGFLTLSMLATMGYEALPLIENRAMGINYGLDKVRFLQPVRAGSRLRARYKLRDVTERSAKEVMFRYEVTVEIEGSDKPALYAESIALAVLT
ncbi:MAG TPA: MaoC family dehydratase [Xanthobacteraceae bacterium]|jgi:acyl dehydratase|nr:MaoC family dehydratase [Xanthobacteraceae bacterium]